VLRGRLRPVHAPGSPRLTPQLTGRLASLRPIEASDADALAAILAEPGVAAWWGRWDAERVRRDLLHPDPAETIFTIEHDGAIAGALLVNEELEPDFRHATIDLFVRTASQGRGVGPDVIRATAAWLLDERGHHRLTIDPASGNQRAIRAYERVGFRPVGTMRRYQRLTDGTWVDALLMDLLADELVR
jgi:aminoglycoside 6'-N-acetyltransferase